MLVIIIIFFAYLGPGCQHSDDHSEGKDFSPGGSFPSYQRGCGGSSGGYGGKGGMEVPPHLGGHQGFEEEDRIEVMAFEDTGHHLEDTVEHCDIILCGSLFSGIKITNSKLEYIDYRMFLDCFAQLYCCHTIYACVYNNNCCLY